jgi:hypothetical protein
MKKIAILALATMAAIPAFSQSFADKLMNQYRVDLDDAILIGGLARDFGLNDSTIFDVRNRYGYNDNELMSALYLNRYGKASWDDIYKMRRNGMGWGQIAHAVGMHPGDFNKARKNQQWSNDRDMFDDIWRDRFNRKGTRRSDIDLARNRGFSYRDAYIADQIARNNRSSLNDVVNRYNQTRDWRVTRERFLRNMQRSNNDRPILSGGRPAIQPRTKAKNPPKKSDQKRVFDKNKGKNKSDDKSKSKGKGKGKGKGNGGFLNGR